MLKLALISILFVGITLFPFLLSRRVKIGGKDETSLIVRSDNIRNPRYFSESFQEMLGNALEKPQTDGKVVLSKSEELRYINNETQIMSLMDKICYIEVPIKLDRKANFEKEIFAKEKLQLAPKSSLRAVYGEKEVIIGENSNLVRWADSKKMLVVKKGTKAGASVTSANRVVLEPGCEFTRAYAPVVAVRNYIQVLDDKPNDVVMNEEIPVYMKIKRNIKKVENMQELRRTIVTKHELTIGSGAVVYGDVKSQKRVHICRNAVITGNIFSDESVVIENGAKILGNVFAEQSLYIGSGVHIGKKGQIKSAIARDYFIIAPDSYIYGYIGTEKCGKTVTEEEFDREVKNREGVKLLKDKNYPVKEKQGFSYKKCKVNSVGVLEFETLEEYEMLDYYAFRKNSKITCVLIPDGAKNIEASMFYGCENLVKVVIPETVEEIGDYAFCGCKNLKEIVFNGKNHFKRIGDYAFSDCNMLSELHVHSIEKIGTAAFRNSENFKHLIIDDITDFSSCGSHAFQNCKSFVSTEIFKNIDNINVSTFYGCKEIESFIVSSNVDAIEGYAFYNCEKLKCIKFMNERVAVNKDSFKGIDINRVLFVDKVDRELRLKEISEPATIAELAIREIESEGEL